MHPERGGWVCGVRLKGTVLRGCLCATGPHGLGWAQVAGVGTVTRGRAQVCWWGVLAVVMALTPSPSKGCVLCSLQGEVCTHVFVLSVLCISLRFLWLQP